MTAVAAGAVRRAGGGGLGRRRDRRGHRAPLSRAAVRDAADPPDTLVLGCTHFPPLLGAIRAVVGAGDADRRFRGDDRRRRSKRCSRRRTCREAQAAGPAARGFSSPTASSAFCGRGPGFLGRAIAPVQVERVDLQEASA